MTKRYSDTNQHDALYNVAREYPGSIEALAHRMGKNPGVLRQKLSPDVKSHYPSFEEVSEIIEKCQGAGVQDALQPLLAMNWRHGLIAFPMPAVADITDEALTRSVCRVMKELGDAAAAVARSLEGDRKIHQHELDEIEKEFQEAIAMLAEWRQRVHMRSQHDQG